MSFTRMTESVENISGLPNRPNAEGYNAETLKAKFDEAGADIKNYLNNVLLPALEAATAAASLGIAPIDGMTAENLQAALEELHTAIGSATTGTIPDESLTTAKYAPRSVTGPKVAEGTLLTKHYADGSVTGPKIANNTMETAKYKDRSVTGPKIALSAIIEEHLGNKAVTEPKLGDNAVGTRSLVNGSVTPEKTTGLQAAHKSVSVAVPALSANTPTEVSVTGVTADCAVLVSAAAASWAVWRDCGVRCTGQAAGKLTFTAETATGQATTANVLILD